MNTIAKSMVDDLIRGLELTRQLEAQLYDPDSSLELRRTLVEEIISIFEKANSAAKRGRSDGNHQRECPNSTGSPLSALAESPSSESSKHPLPKKRKSVSKLTCQVRLGSGPGAEGPLDDGYSWRKYGQKEILGAKHPRGYYRCTHRNSQSCLAMKQVQRSDDDPSVFDVTYRGTHTCQRKPTSPTPISSPFPILNNQSNENNQNLLLSFQTNLKVETENLDVKFQKPTSSTFSFPSTPVNSTKLENHIFSPSSTLDNCFKSSFADVFISPATSESNYFSPCTMSSYGGTTLQGESEFNEIVSGVTSVNDSPMLSIDFLLDSVDFDANFPFESSFI